MIETIYLLYFYVIYLLIIYRTVKLSMSNLKIIKENLEKLEFNYKTILLYFVRDPQCANQHSRAQQLTEQLSKYIHTSL